MANASDMNFELELGNTTSDNDIETLKQDRLAKNTKVSTQRSVNLFKLYLKEKGESSDFEQFSREKPKEILPK